MNDHIRPLAIAALLAISGLVTTPSHAGESSRILHHEPLHLSRSITDNGTLRVSFDAFGQHFDLELVENRRISRLRRHSSISLLRGELTGRAGSWVRLSRRGNRWSGLIFDGDTLFGIEPRATARQRLQHPDTDPTTANIVFRMSDLIMPAEGLSCALDPQVLEVTGDQAIGLLENEQPITLEAAGATRRLSVDVVADYEFSTTWGAGAEAEILSRLNMVDGIFSDQLGIDVTVQDLNIFDVTDDPFTKFDASALLDEVSNYRLARVVSYGPTHLMTGRDLTGTTRGIAYLGAACNLSYGAGLSQQVADPWISSLTTAHELGHNLGAWHDNEASSFPGQTNPCEFEQPGFLMEATINGNDQFSPCSINTIEAWAAGHPSCVVTTGAAPQNSDSGGGSAFGLPGILLLLALAGRRLKSQPQKRLQPRSTSTAAA
ncbi:MAG TPA: hypothetical protein ENK16_09235 [Chromatiales bacterium]|nr:hypothetical protein [Chromatiales bacterium]